jgi:hypothetical protein
MNTQMREHRLTLRTFDVPLHVVLRERSAMFVAEHAPSAQVPQL